jgi:plastocyanin
MNGTLFYIFGITLVVSALGVALVGLRNETFPPSRGALAVVVIYFVTLVGATTTFAVLNAADDQHAREAEEAQAATEAGGASTTVPSSTTTSTASTTSAPAAALKLSAPSSGTPAYDTDKLSAKTGQVTIDFSNPSPVQHDVAIAQGSKIITQSDLISGGSTSVSSVLKPGKYLYYCTVPGHRQAGMQGTLTVK